MSMDQDGDTLDDESRQFEAWVTPHLSAIHRRAGHLTSADEADDVAQEALLRAWQKREKYDASIGPARPWLLAVTSDRAWRWRRDRGRRAMTQPLGEDDDLAEPRGDADGDLDLRRAVRALAPRQREAIVRFYYFGQSTREVAAALGCSEGTVKSTLYDARNRIRIKLGEQDG